MTWALVLAAGQGSRLASATGGMAKQFLEWEGAPLYWRSALVFSRCARIHGIVFVFPEDCLERERARVEALTQARPLGIRWKAVAGGKRRQDSVRLGLAALPAGCGPVLVHDAARPFLSAGLVNRILDGLSEEGCAACVPGLPVVDTIKVVEGGRVTATPDRETLFAVQTPQGFALDALRAAHERAEEEQWTVTDDASLLERCGLPVRLVEGDMANRKITTPEDLRMLQSPQSLVPCTGYGYDVHRYAEEGSPTARPMKLGGVPIPGAPSVVAHSDGDVLLHALMDALLGCLGMGDIGVLFPDSDPAFDNMNSAVLLDAVMERVHREGLRLTHVDMTVIAQIPKVGPHREAIVRNVARLLGMDLACVNLKATTEEGLGFTGERRGMKAVALVSALRVTK